jgi:hypothetical protein
MFSNLMLHKPLVAKFRIAVQIHSEYSPCISSRALRYFNYLLTYDSYVPLYNRFFFLGGGGNI